MTARSASRSSPGAGFRRIPSKQLLDDGSARITATPRQEAAPVGLCLAARSLSRHGIRESDRGDLTLMVLQRLSALSRGPEATSKFSLGPPPGRRLLDPALVRGDRHRRS